MTCDSQSASVMISNVLIQLVLLNIFSYFLTVCFSMLISHYYFHCHTFLITHSALWNYVCMTLQETTVLVIVE